MHPAPMRDTQDEVLGRHRHHLQKQRAAALRGRRPLSLFNRSLVSAPYIIPPGGICGWLPPFSSGFSATMHSVVSSRLATEAAFCNALRTTLVGSMIPAFIRSSNSSVAALKPKAPLLFLILSTTTEPSHPALVAIQRAGSSSALRMIPMPTFSSSPARRWSSDDSARIRATPPPGTTPSSTAARSLFRISGQPNKSGVVVKSTKKRYHASCHYRGRSLKRATVSTKPSTSASTKSAISASTLPLTWKPVKPSLRQTRQQQYGALKIRAKKVRSSIWSGSATRLAQIQDDLLRARTVLGARSAAGARAAPYRGGTLDY